VITGTETDSAFFSNPGTDIRAYSLTDDPIQDVGVPFFNPTYYGALTNTAETDLLVVERGAEDARALLTWIDISGSGSGQRSAIYVTAGGTGADTNGNTELWATRRGSFRGAADQPLVNMRGSPAYTVPGTNGQHAYGSNAENFVLGPGLDTGADAFLDKASDTCAVFTCSTTPQGYENDGYFGTHHVADLVSETAQTAFSRTSRTVAGFMVGIGESADGGYQNPYTLAARSSPNFGMSLDASLSTVGGRAQVVDILDASQINSLVIAFGTIGSDFGPSAFVDDDVFGANRNSNRENTRIVLDNETSAGATVLSPGTYLVSGRAASLDGYRHCTQCAFADWGWWGTRTIGDVANDSGTTRYDEYVHMGTWVAGAITDPAHLPTGPTSASYSGTALANVVSGANQYIAAGDFSLNIDLSNRAGSLAITNLDNANYNAQVSDASTSAQALFSGALTGDNGFSGAAMGALVDDGSTIAAGAIGQFHASGLLALSCVLLLAQSPVSPFPRLQVLVFDTYQRLSPRTHGGAPVLIVDIDEQSIARIGQWPWPRSTLASMIDHLGALGAAAIVFDIVFSAPDRTSPARVLQRADIGAALAESDVDWSALDHDRQFAEALARNPSVAGALLSPDVEPGTIPPGKTGFSFGGTHPTAYLPDVGGVLTNLPSFDAAATGIGMISYRPEFDGVIRRVPLLFHADGALIPALSVEVLRVAQEASGIVARSTGASGEMDTGRAAMVALKVGHFEVPTDADGSLWVYYTDGSGVRVLPAHHLSGAQVDPALADQVAGHIVLMGSSAQGLRDQRATPISASVAGVTIHAEIIDQILSGVWLNRPDWAPGLEIAATVLLGLLAIAAIPFLPVALNTVWALLLAGGAVLLCWFGFADYRLLLDPVPAVSAILVSFGAASAARLLVTENRERFVRQAFGQYLAPALVDRIARNPDELTLGGESRELTLLFCDIRGFTGISERLDPTELTRLLNDFLTPMTDVLLRNGATIDKYMGDAVMAFWNAPVRQDDHAASACRAALEMLAALDTLNAGRTEPLRIGIGLNSGICCVGNLGSTQRFSYSAIGDAVNVAARIESITKQYAVSNLVSETTAAHAPLVPKLEVDRVRVVGRAEPLTIFVLLTEADLRERNDDALAERHQDFLAAYYAGDLEAAGRALRRVDAMAPGSLSGLYAVYADRIAQMTATGVPEDWDGVFVASKK